MTPIQLAREFEAVTAQVPEGADPFAAVRASHPGHRYVRFVDARSKPSTDVPEVVAAIPPGSRCHRYLAAEQTVMVLDNNATEPPEFMHPQVLTIARWQPGMHPWWVPRCEGAIVPEEPA